MPLRRSRKRRSRSPCRYGRKKSLRRGCKSRPGPKRRSRKKSPRRVRRSRKKSPRRVRRSRKKSPRRVRRSRKKSPRRFRYRMNQQEQYPLHRAIENNDINMVRQLILNRYDVNTQYVNLLEHNGLIISGRSDNGLVEIIELPKEIHPYFIACQYHPEYESSINRCHPLFLRLVQSCLNKK